MSGGAVRHRPRGPTTISISYGFAGGTRLVEVEQTSGRRYAAGDHVTVVTDPTRPERVRTTDEPNSDHALSVLGGLLLVAGFPTLAIGVVRRARWSRRLRRARRTGWYPAVVTVAPHRRLGAGDHRAPELEIRYPDGTGITGRAAHAYGVAQLSDRPRRPAWVAGTGADLSVLFRHGPGDDKPYLVPAKAATERDPGARAHRPATR